MAIISEELEVFQKISIRIIKEQELIIGPIAWEEARKVHGFRIADGAGDVVSFEDDPREVLDRLVTQFSKLFGQVSREVCKDSVQDLLAELPLADVPSSLK